MQNPKANPVPQGPIGPEHSTDLTIKSPDFLKRAQEYLTKGDPIKAQYWLRRACGLSG